MQKKIPLLWKQCQKQKNQVKQKYFISQKNVEDNFGGSWLLIDWVLTILIFYLFVWEAFTKSVDVLIWINNDLKILC
jgi:hypothetical protein